MARLKVLGVRKITFSLLVVLVCAPGAVAACGVCVSTQTYDMMRFTPVWLVLGMIGAGAAAIAGHGARLTDNRSEPMRLVVPFGLYFLITVPLLVFGLHLVASFYAPILLLRYAASLKVSWLRTRYIGPPWLRKCMSSLVYVALLAVPLSYLFLPRTAYEIAARTDRLAVSSKMKTSLSAFSGTAAKSPPPSVVVNANGQARSVVAPEQAAGFPLPQDEFRYRIEKVTALSWLVGYYLFRRPGGDPLETVQYASSGTKALMWSRGPNALFDIDGKLAHDLLLLDDDEQVTRSISLLYDPTNGSISPGDIALKHP